MADEHAFSLNADVQLRLVEQYSAAACTAPGLQQPPTGMQALYMRAQHTSCLHFAPITAAPAAGDSQHKLGTAAACAVRRIDLDVRVS